MITLEFYCMSNTDPVLERERGGGEDRIRHGRFFQEEIRGRTTASARIVTEASLKGTELDPLNTKAEDMASSMDDPQREQDCRKPQAVGLQEGRGGQQGCFFLRSA